MRKTHLIAAIVCVLTGLGGCTKPKQSTYKAPRSAADQSSGNNTSLPGTSFKWDGSSDKVDNYWNFQ